MKLKTALSFFLISIALMATTLVVALIVLTDMLDSGAKQIAASAKSIRVAQELENKLLVFNRDMFLDLPYGKPPRMQDIWAIEEEANNLLSLAQEAAMSSEEAALINNVQNTVKVYFEKQKLHRSSPIPPIEKYRETSESVNDMILHINKLISLNARRSNAIQKTVDEQNRMATHLAVFIGSAILSLLTGIFAVVILTVFRPMTTLKQALAQYGSGEMSSRVPAQGIKEMQDMAQTFNRMVDRLEERRQDQLRFISSVAHDLRNPLSSMTMASELLLENTHGRERELTAIVHRQARSLDRLVGDLLDTTRIESGKWELVTTTHDLNETVKDALELYRNSSAIHRFNLAVPATPTYCECDGDRISQVLNNLISNAVKYSPDGGLITVEMYKTNSHAVISISDEGIGIVEEDMSKIFQPFNRTEATKKTIPGIGLGLSASRRIVEAHQGTLTVKSGNGSGSTFTLELPLCTKIRFKEPPAHRRADLSL